MSIYYNTGRRIDYCGEVHGQMEEPERSICPGVEEGKARPHW